MRGFAVGERRPHLLDLLAETGDDLIPVAVRGGDRLGLRVAFRGSELDARTLEPAIHFLEPCAETLDLPLGRCYLRLDVLAEPVGLFLASLPDRGEALEAPDLLAPARGGVSLGLGPLLLREEARLLLLEAVAELDGPPDVRGVAAPKPAR